MDGAHCSDDTCTAFDDERIEFTVDVPFERIPKLKSVIERLLGPWRRVA